MALVARTAGKLSEVVEALGNDHAESFPLDVADRTSLLALPERVVARFGRLDVVVLSGKLATAGYLVPAVFTRLRPIFEAVGARNKRRFLQRRER